MKVLFYITQFNQVKDATKTYLEILSEALTGGSSDLRITKNLKDVKPVDYVITFTVTDFLKLKVNRPRIKIIHWFQGIIPEEAKLKTGSKAQYFAFNFLERFTLKFASFNFFVSEEMKNHYQKKYGFNKQNYFIMPCFNGVIQQKNKFLEKNYTLPKFVYIGSMATWQCVDQVLQVFKLVQDKLPQARLTLLTAQTEKAKQKCKQYQITATIDYVPLDELDKELLKYKYGFLLRENIAVNRVATPTKMSTYLASGVIPIFTNVIKAFNTFDAVKNQIKIKEASLEKIADQIIEFEREPINKKELYQEYQKIFEEYYKKEIYISEIKKIFNKE